MQIPFSIDVDHYQQMYTCDQVVSQAQLNLFMGQLPASAHFQSFYPDHCCDLNLCHDCCYHHHAASNACLLADQQHPIPSLAQYCLGWTHAAPLRVVWSAAHYHWHQCASLLHAVAVAAVVQALPVCAAAVEPHAAVMQAAAVPAAAVVDQNPWDFAAAAAVRLTPPVLAAAAAAVTDRAC
jgi:hypothetical protein